MSEKEKKVPVEEPERGIQPWYPHEIFQAFDARARPASEMGRISIDQ
jgi:hypothetical protein